MPLLLCPNDNAAMQTVDRAGVQFDMCPTCRGVWLDRGELEKLMAAERQEAEPPPPQPGPGPSPWNAGHERPRDDYRDRDYRDRDYRDRDDRHYGHGGYRKKRGSIFDIFDD